MASSTPHDDRLSTQCHVASHNRHAKGVHDLMWVVSKNVCRHVYTVDVQVSTLRCGFWSTAQDPMHAVELHGNSLKRLLQELLVALYYTRMSEEKSMNMIVTLIAMKFGKCQT